MMRFTPLPAGPPGTPPTTFVWRVGRSTSFAGRFLGGTALTVLAILGTVCVLAALAGPALGLTPLLVRTGSMSPAIPAGSLVLVRQVPAEEVATGDVVSVARGDARRVTHRVESITHVAGSVHRLVLRGDANRVADAEPVQASSVDRLVVTVPRLGGLVEALGRTSVQFTLGIVTGLALWWAFAPPSVHHLGRWVPERTGHGQRGARR